MKNKFDFKSIFYSWIFFLIPFSLLEGILALFDIVPVMFNEKPRYGIVGLIIPILFLPMLGILFSGGVKKIKKDKIEHLGN